MLFQQTIRWAKAPDMARDIAELLERSVDGLSQLKAFHAEGRPFLTLPSRTDDLPIIQDRAQTILKSGTTDVVVLGTGGSSLGAKALLGILGPYFGPLPVPRVHVPDNLGANLMDQLFRGLVLSKSHFLAISKSGGTAETVAQLIAAYTAVSAVVGPEKAATQFTMITEPGDTVFRRLAADLALTVFDHDPSLGGRFSVMSLVGLLPACLAGVEVQTVRRGAKLVLDQAMSADQPDQVPAAVGAAIGHLLQTRMGCNIAVMLAYDSRLEFLMRWWAQLWAESLGKQGLGTTPVAALGPVDQHSQVQLYLDGPHDKFFTLLKPVTQGSGPMIDPDLAKDPALAYLQGRHIGDLVDAEADATAEALLRRNRPVRTISLDRVDHEVIGALMMHFMIETVIAAALSGVDAFDQPAVEEGKILTKEALRGGTLSKTAGNSLIAKTMI